jgi:RNA methyltransferase, TrmH family
MTASYARDPAPGTRDAARGATAVDRVRTARRDPTRVVLEGVHALKHAVRFGAEVEVVLTPDAAGLDRLLADLAPDVVLPVPVAEVTPAAWRSATSRELPSPALSVARRPAPSVAGKVGGGSIEGRAGRVVVLEQPRHLGNLGAAVRVAAAADAAGLLVVGDADPWHPTAVRAAAGLQFALPVARADRLPDTGRPVVAVAPDHAPADVAEAVTGTGSPPRRLSLREVPAEAVLLFGTERGGLSAALRARAGASVSIPMREGVSSLNLATAVAVLLYAG